jgi:hypothetical protein
MAATVPGMSQLISRSELASVVDSLRAVLAAIDAGELSCSPAYRNRLQGAVVALDALAREAQTNGAAPGSPSKL